MNLRNPFKNLLKRLLKKPSKKKIVIISGIAVCVILTGVGLMFLLGPGEDENTANEEGKVENIQINQIDYDNIVMLNPFKWIQLENTSYMSEVSIGIALEVISEDKIDAVESKTDNIRTLVRKMIQGQRWIGLRSPEGKLKFKYMLIQKINTLFPDIVIRNLYLTHLIMRKE